MMLLTTVIGKLPGHQEPQAATVVVGEVDWITLSRIVTGPLPGDSGVGLVGSAPAIMMPPPSSYDRLNQMRLCVMVPFGLRP